MGVEVLSPLDHNVHYRQAIMPNHLKGTFLGDDTDNHDFLFKGMGKSKIGISIDNPPDHFPAGDGENIGWRKNLFQPFDHHCKC